MASSGMGRVCFLAKGSPKTLNKINCLIKEMLRNNGTPLLG